MNVQTVDFQSDSAGKQFAQSLHDSGFVVLKNHPVSQQKLDRLYHAWFEFFQNNEKQDYLYDPEDKNGTQEGYFPLKVSETAVGASSKDLKEFFHVVPGAPLPSALEQDILEYREEILQLGSTLLGWIQNNAPLEIHTGFSEPLSTVLCPTASLLRVLHYPPLSGEETAGAVRAAPHEDINLITILPVSHQPGLQVKTLRGEWLNLETSTGELIVNIGDMLEKASDGYFPSTTHQVINPVDAEENISRISIPFFLTPHLEFVLSDSYTAGSYLDERLKLLNR